MVLKPTARADFFSLPPEIRNNIYSYVLEQGEPFRINRPHPSDPQYFRNSLNWPCFRPPRRLALALVNKQISQETMAIIYRSNTFEFADLEALSSFLGGAPIMQQHLMAFKLCRMGDPMRNPIGHHLRIANLRKITIESEYVYMNALSDHFKISVVDLARELRSFLQLSLDARRSVNEVLEIVRFKRLRCCSKCESEDSTCSKEGCLQPWENDRANAHLQNVSAAFKRLVIEQLQLAMWR